MHISLYLYALGLTLIIELPLAVLFIRDKKFFCLAVVVNVITNPAANFLVQSNPYLFIESAYAVYILEILIVVFEFSFYAFFYRKKYKKLAIFAFVANAVSYLAGVIIQKIIY